MDTLRAGHIIAVTMKAIIALEDGTAFHGEGFGARGESFGEAVFNTSMTGYQEVLTDPSYRGQIVTMTYPLIGNYGINEEDHESSRIWMSGFVVKEYSKIVSNWRATCSLGDFLTQQNVVGIEGVDTRALTKHIRDAGAMTAVISTEDLNVKSLVKKARTAPNIVGRDLVREVVPDGPYKWSKKGRYTIAALDCGIKRNILRLLESHGCAVTVFPAGTDPETILASKPDGFFLSNGPGDPNLPYLVNTAKAMLARELPTFGICLGHQILGLALGGSAFKLKFGHRGANHPVKNLLTGSVEITVQNHGFCIDPASLDQKKIEITHINLNDGTLEGFRHKKLPAFSVQYHPEAAAGPRDSEYLFGEFINLLGKNVAEKN